MLPKALLRFGDYTPSGCLRRLLMPLFGGNVSAGSFFSAFLPLLVYSCLLLAAALISLRHKPLSGEES